MALTLIVNGTTREFADLTPPVTLSNLVDSLALKADRIAIEVNGRIAERALWSGIDLAPNDRIELVHFVGGG